MLAFWRTDDVILRMFVRSMGPGPAPRKLPAVTESGAVPVGNKGQQPPRTPNDPQRTRPARNRSRKSPNALELPPGRAYGTAPRYDRRGAIPKVVGRPLAVSGSGQRRRSGHQG